MSVTITSRVGRKPIIIPTGVDIKIQDQQVLIQGPKGKASLPLHPLVELQIADKTLKLLSDKSNLYCRSGTETKLKKSIVGTMRSKIDNVIHGVSKGYEKKLLLVGVGYKAQAKGKTLNLTLGYSHPVEYVIPEGITLETPSQTEIVIKGIDKHLVGQVSATIREFRGPELYKGKGIRYSNEIIVLKETKKK